MTNFYYINANINGLIILEEIENPKLQRVRDNKKVRGRVFKVYCSFCKTESECSVYLLGKVRTGIYKGCLNCDARKIYPTQVCIKCNTEKPSSEFDYLFNKTHRLVSTCFECKNKKKSENFKKNKDVSRNQARKRNFGIDNEMFDIFFEGQGKVCAICKSPYPGKQFWCIDHDHKTGRIRGILCSKCNSGLGLFKDKISNLKSAIEYLKLLCPLCEDPSCLSWKGYCPNTKTYRQENFPNLKYIKAFFSN